MRDAHGQQAGQEAGQVVHLVLEPSGAFLFLKAAAVS